MKRLVLALALFAALALGISNFGVASAASHDAPGTPGTANCHGQTIAYVTHAGLGGLGQIAAANDLSVQDVQALVDQYCTTP